MAPVRLAAADENLLIVGPLYSGKSYHRGLIAQQLVRLATVLRLRPEGDDANGCSRLQRLAGTERLCHYCTCSADQRLDGVLSSTVVSPAKWSSSTHRSSSKPTATPPAPHRRARHEADQPSERTTIPRTYAHRVSVLLRRSGDPPGHASADEVLIDVDSIGIVLNLLELAATRMVGRFGLIIFRPRRR